MRISDWSSDVCSSDLRSVTFLDGPEIAALLAAPDRSTWTGRRDHILLLVALQTGLRASELTGLRRRDLVLGTGAHVRCLGNGRKERRSEEHTSELQSPMRISYAVFCLNKNKPYYIHHC